MGAALLLCVCAKTSRAQTSEEGSTKAPASRQDAEADLEKEPPLPPGLEKASGEDEPQLPSGLNAIDEPEPTLPAGLETHPASRDEPPVERSPSLFLPFEWSIFTEARGGDRIVSDPDLGRTSMAELRAHLELSQSFRPWSTSLRLAVDGIADAVAKEHTPQLETGQGALDLRTASVTSTPAAWIDTRLGRQILTWGTGDLLFINDLFPKDWLAFLIGRDIDYLKAPSDAAKFSFFTPLIDLDVVFTPVFDSDRLPRRDRVSSFEPTLDRIVGEETPPSVERPDRLVRDSELATRVHRSFGPWEAALYGYRGFWKSPEGFDPVRARGTHPALAVYGASLRGPVFGGIANAETGFYDSLDDRQGVEPLVRNSEVRALVGYELNLGKYVTSGLQYYVEHMLDFEKHQHSVGGSTRERSRHVVTSRIHVRALAERLSTTVFVFTSPSDVDAHLRVSVGYVLGDHWHLMWGGNFFFGEEEHTFFGQFRRNSNVFTALRFSKLGG